MNFICIWINIHLLSFYINTRHHKHKDKRCQMVLSCVLYIFHCTKLNCQSTAYHCCCCWAISCNMSFGLFFSLLIGRCVFKHRDFSATSWSGVHLTLPHSLYFIITSVGGFLFHLRLKTSIFKNIHMCKQGLRYLRCPNRFDEYTVYVVWIKIPKHKNQRLRIYLQPLQR